MSIFKQIKGFVFDLDGVITDTARLHTKAWHEIADQVGTPWSHELADKLRGIGREESLDIILRAGGKQDAYTDAEKTQLATAKNEHYQRLISTLTPQDILPGIPELLHDLHEHEYLMSIASASRNAPAVLERLGLTQYFPKIVDPNCLHTGKPNPEIFIKGAAILGLEPRQCIGVEDAAAGVQAIDAAGEISVGIGGKDVLRGATIVFPTTSSLTLANISGRLKEAA